MSAKTDSLRHPPRGGDPTRTVRRDADSDGNAVIARLMIMYPVAVASAIPIPTGEVVLGRQHADGVHAVEHPTVSRRHCSIQRSGRAIIVSDLGSHNGAWLNTVPLGSSPTPVVDGDVLRFGDVLAVVEVAADGRSPLSDPTDAVPGDSLAANRLRARLDSISADPSPVLLLGDSGTGKESVAAQIHRASGRTGALVVTNCAALAPTLVESQLFGHEKGAFTGAGATQTGFFRAADDGTLFLDEIGEVPLGVQPKLLRAVELGEVVPLGGTKRHIVDARIVAATNRDLRVEVDEGRFRRDLYARLSLLETRLPSLAERRADIVDWLEILHRRWAAARGRSSPPALIFSADALERILAHEWAENLRGLDRLVHELGAREERTDLAALPPWLKAPGPEPSQRSDAPPIKGVRRPSREVLVAALEEAQWNVAAVANAYGKDRKQIYRWLTALGIEVPR